MRALPVYAAIALSLAFTVGGVAINGKADPPLGRTPAATMSSAAEQSPAALPLLEQPQPKQCGVPIPPSRPPMHMQLKPGSSKGQFVTLNTRGYNYALPGEIQFDPAPAAERAPAPPASPR
ncbi:MAG TPA: hypothetical protein VMR31_18685 [Myxococcota bacterium]|nr:hypothetical protein [Myxococcota bacterium]